MFNNKEDNYLNVIKHTWVYISVGTRSSNKKLLIFNFIFLTLLSYVTFTYFQSNNNTLSLPVSKQAVLGVSKTVDDSEFLNEIFLEILKDTEVDTLQDSMKVLMSEPSIQSKSSYTEDIARELDNKSSSKH